MDIKTTPPVPIEPITVTLVGGTGDGGSPIKSGDMAVTPDHQPNIKFKVISTLQALSIRAFNLYGGIFLGMITGGAATGLVTAPDFWHLCIKAAGYSIPVATPLFLKDILTLTAGWEKSHPLATGNV